MTMDHLFFLLGLQFIGFAVQCTLTFAELLLTLFHTLGTTLDVVHALVKLNTPASESFLFLLKLLTTARIVLFSFV